MTAVDTPRRPVTRAALVLAVGILLSTIAAVGLADDRWAALTAPAVMACTLVWAGDLVHRSPSGRPTARRTGVVLAVAVVAAGAIVISTNPGDLAMIMPVLGAATGGGLLAVTVRSRRR